MLADHWYGLGWGDVVAWFEVACRLGQTAPRTTGDAGLPKIKSWQKIGRELAVPRNKNIDPLTH